MPSAPAPGFAAPGLGLLVFDLDGTLIDSRADLVASVNAMLAALDRPPLPADQIAAYVGDGAALLVRRALGPGCDDAIAAAGLELFLDYYRAHKLDHTTLYPGVGEAIPALAARYSLAVLTNKPVGPSRAILAALGIADCFGEIFGGDSFARKKPDPMGLIALLAGHGAAPAATLMVGDSPIDIQTGRAAGTWTCAVTWGFVPPERLALAPADWVVDSFPELAAPLLGDNC